MPPLTILMFIFSGMLYLYALILFLTKDSRLICFDYMVKMKNRKKYARQFAKVIALVATVPILTGLAGIMSTGLAISVFVVGLIITIWIGTKWMENFIE